MPKGPMVVVGYARVSTENQLENYSIEEQTERLKAYCSAKGWSLRKLYVDGGYSGGNTDRPSRCWPPSAKEVWTPWWSISWTGCPARRRTP